MLEVDGNIWELMGAIAAHMGAKMVPTVRQICKLYAPYGSHIRCMGATGTVWEPYGPLWAVREVVGTIWEPHAPYGGHMGASCTMRGVDGLWEPCVAMWETDGTIWEADGAIWEERAQYGGHTVVVSPGGNCVHSMGSVCTVLVPGMLYGSYIAPNGRRMPPGGRRVPYGRRWCCMEAIWQPCGLYWRWMAPYGTCWHPMGVIWQPFAPYRRQMAYGSHVVPDGSHLVPCRRWMVSYGSCVS
jgi:hypothetical protein